MRDSEKAAGKGDSDEEKAKGADTKDVVASLHAVIEHHRKAEERLKNQVQTLKASHTKVSSHFLFFLIPILVMARSHICIQQ